MMSINGCGSFVVQFGTVALRTGDHQRLKASDLDVSSVIPLSGGDKLRGFPILFSKINSETVLIHHNIRQQTRSHTRSHYMYKQPVLPSHYPEFSYEIGSNHGVLSAKSSVNDCITARD